MCLYLPKYFRADRCAVMCAFNGCYCLLIVDFLEIIMVVHFATEFYVDYFTVVEMYARFSLETCHF